MCPVVCDCDKKRFYFQCLFDGFVKTQNSDGKEKTS